MAFDLKTALGSIAPTLATMLGGPLAGTAVGALCSAFGLAPTASADDVTKIVQTGMTPETIAAVRAADQKHAEALAQQGIDLAKLNADHEAALIVAEVDDRKNARGMQVSNRSNVPAILSGLITVGFFGILVGMMTGSLKVSESQALLLLLGSLSTAWGCVVSFWFGTTHDSGRKTEMLAGKVAS